MPKITDTTQTPQNDLERLREALRRLNEAVAMLAATPNKKRYNEKGETK